jgi:hypothetical protein
LRNSSFNGGGSGVGRQSNGCFRATRYTPDYAAFDDKDMTPGSTLDGGKLITVESGKVAAVSSSDVVHVPGEFSLSSYTDQSNSNATTAIAITIPQNTEVTVKMYNADGREIATLVNQYLSAGNYSYTWSANGFASSIYFVRLVTKNYATANRIFLLQ